MCKPSSIKLRKYIDLLKWGFIEIRHSLRALAVPALVQQPIALQVRTQVEGLALSSASSSDDRC